jgi:carboxyl-terminal processing protease
VDAEDVDDAYGIDEHDVLLTEAGNVLVDALLLKQQRFAVHSGLATQKPEAE